MCGTCVFGFAGCGVRRGLLEAAGFKVRLQGGVEGLQLPEALPVPVRVGLRRHPTQGHQGLDPRLPAEPRAGEGGGGGPVGAPFLFAPSLFFSGVWSGFIAMYRCDTPHSTPAVAACCCMLVSLCR